MESFCFKQFSVRQAKSAMKVNTDGVLLGAWLTVPGGQPHSDIDSGKEQDHNSEQSQKLRILDLGTGTGVIALIIAQRLAAVNAMNNHPQEPALTRMPAEILGIDPDEPSAEEARFNFSASPWSSFMKADSLSFSELTAKEQRGAFSLIASNPPYFNNSLKAPCPRRSSSRHTDDLPFEIIISGSEELLCEGGILSVILPFAEGMQFASLVKKSALRMMRICRVETVRGGKVKRVMMEFVKRAEAGGAAEAAAEAAGVNIAGETIAIQESAGGPYTNEYSRLTGDLYLKF